MPNTSFALHADERRQHERFPLLMLVHVVDQQQEKSMWVTDDISSSGLCLRRHHPRSFGVDVGLHDDKQQDHPEPLILGRVEMTLFTPVQHLSLDASPTIHLFGEVVWCIHDDKQTKMGVRFAEDALSRLAHCESSTQAVALSLATAKQRRDS